MTNKLMQAFRDERGGQTLEWISVGALILAIAFAIYGGGASGIQSGLKTAATNIATALGGIKFTPGS